MINKINYSGFELIVFHFFFFEKNYSNQNLIQNLRRWALSVYRIF